LGIETPDERDRSASGRDAKRSEIRRLPSRVFIEIDPVGDHQKLLRRQAGSFGRKLGNRLTHANVPIDPALRDTIQPKVPSCRVFRHANARNDGPHSRSACGNSAQQIGMKQKCLDNLRLLGDQQPF
jgi:hypothetical protein